MVNKIKFELRQGFQISYARLLHITTHQDRVLLQVVIIDLVSQLIGNSLGIECRFCLLSTWDGSRSKSIFEYNSRGWFRYRLTLTFSVVVSSSKWWTKGFSNSEVTLVSVEMPTANFPFIFDTQPTKQTQF